MGTKIPKYGEIWYVNFGKSTKYNLYNGTRPALVVQGYCEKADTVYVAPISTADRPERPYIQVIELKERSYVHYEQIIAVSVKSFNRFIRELGTKEFADMQKHILSEFGLLNGLYNQTTTCFSCNNKSVIVHSIRPDSDKDLYVSGTLYIAGYDNDFTIPLKSLGLPSFNKRDNIEDVEDYLNSGKGIRCLLRNAIL